MQEDTIVAMATAAGRAGVGVLRLSGSALLPMAQALSGGKIPVARRAMYTDFLDEQGQAIDSGLMLYFPAPHSFTGQDVLELQGHGGPVVMQMLLSRCLALGARMAEPGEFSKRAFLNNKIDLAQAESIADLIDAASQSAARMALRSLKGQFSEHIQQLQSQLITLRMLVEATLDFPEEEIDFLEKADAMGQLRALIDQVGHILAQAQQGAMLREGLRVALLGAPNVGKSSLLNALAGEAVAIVTDIAGTTRDTVREQITLDGIPVHIVDTAGLRASDDIVETMGMARSEQAALDADIALVVIDPQEGVNPQTQALLAKLSPATHCIEVHNKADLQALPVGVWPGEQGLLALPTLLRVSAKTGDGLLQLKQAILQQVGWQGDSEGLFLARRRHLEALQQTQAQLWQAKAVHYDALDLLAEHLRLAQEALSQITGEHSADDLLGVIFSRFCIGK